MMGNSESVAWSLIYNDIKSKHDAAFRSIDSAIKLEEEENPIEALEKYKEGILFIDEALNVQVESPNRPDDTWVKARDMITKMKTTRAEVLTRINSIQACFEFVAPAPPPSYDEAMSGFGGDTPRTYGELANALRTLHVDDSSGPVTIIYIHENVRLYFIRSEGTVTATSELSTLKIGLIEGVQGQPSTTFLQVGDWVYPLVAGVSPCFHTEYGAFILPDVQAEVPGSSVGIILPPNEDKEVYELLEDILHGVLGEKPPLVAEERAGRERRATGISGVISRGIVTGAYYVSKGLIKGAEKTGDFINYGTPKLLNHINPANEAKPIPTKVQKSFEVAQDISGKAVQVSGFVANKVGTATMALGRYLAPHIQKQGTKILTNVTHMTKEEASEKIGGVLTVAAGAVEGFSTVYSGLETSAKILGNNLTNNTVKVVEHKYGHPSKVLAENTLYTAGNLMMTAHNVSHITPKGIAKQSAKATGKAMIEDIQEDLKKDGTIYPNLAIEAKPSTSGLNDKKPEEKDKDKN